MKAAPTPINAFLPELFAAFAAKPANVRQTRGTPPAPYQFKALLGALNPDTGEQQSKSSKKDKNGLAASVAVAAPVTQTAPFAAHRLLSGDQAGTPHDPGTAAAEASAPPPAVGPTAMIPPQELARTNADISGIAAPDVSRDWVQPQLEPAGSTSIANAEAPIRAVSKSQELRVGSSSATSTSAEKASIGMTESSDRPAPVAFEARLTPIQSDPANGRVANAPEAPKVPVTTISGTQRDSSQEVTSGYGIRSAEPSAVSRSEPTRLTVQSGSTSLEKTPTPEPAESMTRGRPQQAAPSASETNFPIEPLATKLDTRWSAVRTGPLPRTAEPEPHKSTSATPVAQAPDAVRETGAPGKDVPEDSRNSSHDIPRKQNEASASRSVSVHPEAAQDSVKPEMSSVAAKAQTASQGPAIAATEMTTATTKPETPTPEVPAEQPSAEPAPAATPANSPAAREIKLELTGGDQKVEVRLTERSGEVHLSVRTPDTKLAGALREDLPNLSAKLEQAGFRSEPWRPAGVAGTTERRLPEAANTATSPNSGGQQRQDERGQQQDQQQKHRGPANSSHFSQERKDFAWLLQSLR